MPWKVKATKESARMRAFLTWLYKAARKEPDGFIRAGLYQAAAECLARARKMEGR